MIPRRVNSALMCALFLVCICSPVAAATVISSDPQGDTFGIGAVQLDIKSLTASLLPDPTPSDLVIAVEFFDDIAPPSDPTSPAPPNILFGYWT